MAETKLGTTTRERWIIGITMALTAIFLWLILRDDVKKPPKKMLGGPEFGEIPESWYPDALSVELFDAIDGNDDVATHTKIYEKINFLNDNQLITVYNDFNKKYAGESTYWGAITWGTMTQAIRNEITASRADSTIILLANMERLNLP